MVRVNKQSRTDSENRSNFSCQLYQLGDVTRLNFFEVLVQGKKYKVARRTSPLAMVNFISKVNT